MNCSVNNVYMRNSDSHVNRNKVSESDIGGKNVNISATPNVHAPTEDKCDDTRGSFYEELEGVFDQFPKYHMKILLGDFNAKVGREDIFKPTIGNESLHEISNDNGVRVVNFATSKNLVVRSTMFPHRKIHKYTWTSADCKMHNQIDHVLVDRR
jgi:hypothetical protein